MSNAVLIIGESGSGKSTSIRTLPPEQTFILNVIDKPLPFRGFKQSYKPISGWGDKEGNYYATDDHAKILHCLNVINNSRPEIKYLVIDDFGYSISNQFMRKALQKGYDKFSELAKDAFEILHATNNLRDDLFVFVMMHSDVDQQGKSKPKTVGKMIDQHVCIEGKFTYVLHAIVSDGKYRFITNNDGVHMAKTPMALFETPTINNDLLLVATEIQNYMEPIQ